MKEFHMFDWKPAQCQKELRRFGRLLGSATSLGEQEVILPFFRKNVHLSALLGCFHPTATRYGCVAYEYPLFGEFTCDLVVGDRVGRTFAFVEFEDASADSVFVKRKGKHRPEWSPRFEHGYSQIVDWFYMLDDMEHTSEFEVRFGRRSIDYFGLLVVGRNDALSEREAKRLHWRQEKTLVNSNKIHCVTFDRLHEFLGSRLDQFLLA
jgi:hypothetical protein